MTAQIALVIKLRFQKIKLVRIAHKGWSCHFPSPVLLASSWLPSPRLGDRTGGEKREGQRHQHVLVTCQQSPDLAGTLLPHLPHPILDYLLTQLQVSSNHFQDPKTEGLPQRVSAATQPSGFTNVLTNPYPLVVARDFQKQKSETRPGTWELGSGIRV